jgi:foldase protein PrsA
VPKKRRRAKIPTPAWERPRGTIGRRLLGRGFQFYGAVAVVAVTVVGVGVIVGAIGYIEVADELEKRGRPGSTAIQVEDARFRLDYFASRMTMYVDQSGGQGVVQPPSALPAVSDLLIQEEIVRRFAGEKDVTVTDDEIREEIASRLGITADDESFDDVFQQELLRSELSETDYRQMIEAAVVTDKLREKFLAEVPASADSVHYRQIVVSEPEKADELVAEIEAGGDFAALAAQDFNLDFANKEEGGDVGWVPRGVLDASAAELIFPMEVGEITVIPTPGGMLVIEILEKAGDHPVEEDQKEPLAARLFDEWIQEKQQPIEVQNFVLSENSKCNWAVGQAFGIDFDCGI